MIERHWKGIVRIDETANYLKHLLGETFPSLKQIQGFVQGRILKRSVADGIEFYVITVWESMDAIERFAGANAERAVVPERARKMMIAFDEHVIHYEVLNLT